MRINPINYGQKYKNLNFGNFYDKRACEGYKKLAGDNVTATVNVGESRFLQTFHGWDDDQREYVLKTELNEEYFNSRDAKVQKRVQDMIQQAKERDYIDFDRTDLFWKEIANLAYQLRPYEQYDSSYPYVRKDNAYYERIY